MRITEALIINMKLILDTTLVQPVPRSIPTAMIMLREALLVTSNIRSDTTNIIKGTGRFAFGVVHDERFYKIPLLWSC